VENYIELSYVLGGDDKIGLNVQTNLENKEGLSRLVERVSLLMVRHYPVFINSASLLSDSVVVLCVVYGARCGDVKSVKCSVANISNDILHTRISLLLRDSIPSP
jgi:hypothetical protein